MNAHCENDILKYALENGMIDFNTIQIQVDMQKRKKYLEMHPYSIWEGNDGFWHTYLPKGDDGRRPVKKKNREDIESVVVNYWKDNSDQTFSKRYSVWVDRQKDCERSENTIYKYQCDYKRFFQGYAIEKMCICDINDTVLTKHIKKVLGEKKIRYKALKEIFGYIKGVFKKSVMDKVIKAEEDPCQYIDLEIFRKYCYEPETKTAEERTLSDKEKKILLEKLEKPENKNPNYVAYFAVKLSLYTGMRVGELAALRWEDVDFEKKIITIRHAEVNNRLSKEYVIKTTKNHKVRTFPLTRDIETVLKETKRYEIEHGYIGEFVFQNEHGRLNARTISECARNKTMSKEFSTVKSVHAIRRTLNSNLRCMGVSATVASALIGNTEKVNDMNYTYDVTPMEMKMDFVTKAGKIV